MPQLKLPEFPVSPASTSSHEGGEGRGRNVTRRRFALGAAATAVAGGVAALLARNIGGGQSSNERSASAPVVVDSGEATNITEEFEQVDHIRLVQRGSYDLPLGSVLQPAEGRWIPVVQPGVTADAIIAGAAFDRDTGACVAVVPEPIGTGSNTLILDTRCSDSVYAWSEVNMSERSWTLYASSFRDGALTGDTSTLWTSDANWDPPAFCCAGNQVLWQVQPALSGSKTSEDSSLYRWRAGESSADQLYVSHGRFACEPSVSRDCVTITPRVPGESSASAYYGITALSKSDLTQVVDQLVMPATVRPFRATRVGDRFAFAVEATYGSGGLLANMGYYLGTADGHITWLSREPAAGVWGRDNVFAFKSLSSYIVYDEEAQEFGVLLACDRAVDYGEYPASTGDADVFVTYATVKDQATGYPKAVTVRTYDLISRAELDASIKAKEEAESAEDDEGDSSAQTNAA